MEKLTLRPPDQIHLYHEDGSYTKMWARIQEARPWIEKTHTIEEKVGIFICRPKSPSRNS